MKHFKAQDFVPKEVYTQYGDKSIQFVSDNIIKLADFIYEFFDSYYKKEDSNVEKTSITINNWSNGGSFNNRGLRTVKYINEQIAKGVKTSTLSQHIGGSTNAIDFNVTIHFKGGKSLLINSNDVYDIIVKNEKVFMDAGLTTLENKVMTQGWTHADCRFTGLTNLYIVNP